jgi:hypothetical protein
VPVGGDRDGDRTGRRGPVARTTFRVPVSQVSVPADGSNDEDSAGGADRGAVGLGVRQSLHQLR